MENNVEEGTLAKEEGNHKQKSTWIAVTSLFFSWSFLLGVSPMLFPSSLLDDVEGVELEFYNR